MKTSEPGWTRATRRADGQPRGRADPCYPQGNRDSLGVRAKPALPAGHPRDGPPTARDLMKTSEPGWTCATRRARRRTSGPSWTRAVRRASVRWRGTPRNNGLRAGPDPRRMSSSNGLGAGPDPRRMSELLEQWTRSRARPAPHALLEFTARTMDSDPGQTRAV
ncbi:hypothetical protein T492DRAFT_1041055 [Pavlovales sp. CCMP2436]|nr:hypothetical protein T492DRAFT_1041055 [Pavlovales sp. CCMP2436]